MISHHSASLMWQQSIASSGVYAPDNDDTPLVDVTVERNGRCRRPGIRLHRVRRIDPVDRTVLDGIPITTTIRTMLDLAPLLDAARLEQLAAQFARAGILDLDELAARIDNSETATFVVPVGELVLRVGRDPSGRALCGMDKEEWTQRETIFRDGEKKYFRLSIDPNGKTDIQRADP